MRGARLKLSRCALSLALAGGAAAHAQDAPPPPAISPPSNAARPGHGHTNVEIAPLRKPATTPRRAAEPQAPASPQGEEKN